MLKETSTQISILQEPQRICNIPEKPHVPSLRAQVVTRRTYNRPLNTEETQFESWEQTVDRVINHQRWLWETQINGKLNDEQEAELGELRKLHLVRKAVMAGRTLWMGGTDISRELAATQFNCAGLVTETVYDVVDGAWLLLQGCGVGFLPKNGTLTGFAKPIKHIEIIRSARTEKGGREENIETFDSVTKHWTIQVGDSARAWARFLGKILAGKFAADKLTLDFSALRPAGLRLSKYGWVSSGDAPLARACEGICNLMNKKADALLSAMDILDIMNWIGTILSSRRSAEIALLPEDHPEWREFATAKKDYWLHGNQHRCQSNNSLMFFSKPSRERLEELFAMMQESGGSEPGLINMQAALRRAPWCRTLNPCAEILLANKGFCNLVEIDTAKFKGDDYGLKEAIRIMARANYRQTCVDFRDGVLQEAWHLNNQYLRLCGVGLTGLDRRPDFTEYDLKSMNRAAWAGACSMADEFGTPKPKNVTTVKPSGSLSKIMDTTEGLHKPLGKYMFNNINFGNTNPIIQKAIDAGYRVFPNPDSPENTLITMPVCWENVEFDKVVKEDGSVVEVNLDSAVKQLERYKQIQTIWTDQNTSNTISYSPDEVPEIIDWMLANWDSYVGVSFLYRNDPSKTAEDLGYQYLPQEVVTKEVYEEYVKQLKPLELDEEEETVLEGLDDAECAGGMCPVR